jgi:ribonuclease BN (tRNA processing enzyme)
MLVETGPLIMHQLARAGLDAGAIEHLFVSHGHGDHTLGFPMLALNRRPAPTPLHVYTGRSAAATLQVLCRVSYAGLAMDEQVDIVWHALREEQSHTLPLTPQVTLRTATMPHPPGVPTLAARWDFVGGPSITFVTDTFFNEAAIALAQGSDLLIHEASYSAVLQPEQDPGVNHHSNARQAGQVARRAGCRRLALVHLGAEIGDHPDVLAEEARGDSALAVIVPDDGARVRLGESA